MCVLSVYITSFFLMTVINRYFIRSYMLEKVESIKVDVSDLN